MFKCNKLLGVSLAAVMSISATATNVFAIDTSVIDEKWGKPTVVYGGGLSEDQIQSTRELFDIEDTNNVYETSVDANDLYNYLGIAGVEIKQELAQIKQNQGSAATTEQVEQVIQDALKKFNLSDIISQDDIDKLIAFAKKYQNTSAIDSQEVLNQLNKLSGSLKNQLSGLFTKAQSEGWFDKIINFIKSLFN